MTFFPVDSVFANLDIPEDNSFSYTGGAPGIDQVREQSSHCSQRRLTRDRLCTSFTSSAVLTSPYPSSSASIAPQLIFVALLYHRPSSMANPYRSFESGLQRRIEHMHKLYRKE